MSVFTEIDELAINTIRCYTADMVEKAQGGHPGTPIALAPLAHVLWSRHLKFNPSNPLWYNRDRFVLSNGHACALLYTILHLTGYEQYTEDQLENFLQPNSVALGYPISHFDGIEVTTGLSGQGIANAVGLAIGEEQMAATFNRPNYELFNNYTYVFCGDGDMMEGITSEAASLAGHLKLGRLIVFYDDNQISMDGSTDMTFSEDVSLRFEAFGWHVITVKDGDSDLGAIHDAISKAQSFLNKPSLIRVKTTIGFGTKHQGTRRAQRALGKTTISEMKKRFGFDDRKDFYIPSDVRNFYSKLKERSTSRSDEWLSLFSSYQKEYKKEGEEITKRFNGEIAKQVDLRHLINTLQHQSEKTHSTSSKKTAKKSSKEAKKIKVKKEEKKKGKKEEKLKKKIIEKIIFAMEEMSNQTGGWTISGSADESEERRTTYLPSHAAAGDFTAENYRGRHIRFGLRHQSMISISNGIAAYGSFLPLISLRLPLLPLILPSLSMTGLSRHPLLLFLLSDHPTDPPYTLSPSSSPTTTLYSSFSPSSFSSTSPIEGKEKSSKRSSMLSSSQSWRPHSWSSYGVPGSGGWLRRRDDGSKVGEGYGGAEGEMSIEMSGGSEMNGLLGGDDWMKRAAMMTAGELGREGRILFFRPADGDEFLSSLSLSLFDPLRRPAIFSLSPSLPSSSTSSIGSVGGGMIQSSSSSSPSFGGVEKGGYVVMDRGYTSPLHRSGEIKKETENIDNGERDLILIACGDDVEKCVSAANLNALKSLRVRVISVPSLFLLSQQPIEYLLSLFPHSSPVLSVDSSSSPLLFSPFCHFSLSYSSVAPSPFLSVPPSPHSSHHSLNIPPPPSSSPLSLGEAGRWGLEGSTMSSRFTADQIAVKGRETFDRFLSLFPDRRSLLSPVVFSSFSSSHSSIPYF